MFLWLASLLHEKYTFLRLFEYLTFRSIMCIFTSLLLSLFIGPKLIRRLQLLQVGQVVRHDGPESHYEKKGTPTMGGALIIFSVTSPLTKTEPS